MFVDPTGLGSQDFIDAINEGVEAQDYEKFADAQMVVKHTKELKKTKGLKGYVTYKDTEVSSWDILSGDTSRYKEVVTEASISYGLGDIKATSKMGIDYLSTEDKSSTNIEVGKKVKNASLFLGGSSKKGVYSKIQIEKGSDKLSVETSFMFSISKFFRAAASVIDSANDAAVEWAMDEER